jgi:hypothetical protein
MIFADQVVTEITVPSNVPFLPGNDVIGIGTEIPAELMGEDIEAAIIFYTDDWDTSATTPKVKFFFIGVRAKLLVSGYAYSNNPSTTPTGTVVRAELLSLNGTTGAGLSEFIISSARYITPILPGSSANPIFRIQEAPTTFDGGGLLQLYDADANRILQIQPSPTSPSYGCAISVIDANTGLVILQWTNSLDTLKFVNSQYGYGQWVACTYANGWSAKAAPGFGQRSGVGVIRLPDGTVHLSGVANRGTSVPGTYCVQLPSSAYWPNYGTTFTCFQEGAPDYISMTLDSGNGAMTIAGPCRPRERFTLNTPG